MTLICKNIEQKYNCKVSKDSGFDSNKKYWVALENGNYEEEMKFTYADGWTLDELVKNIEKEIIKNED